MAGMSTGLRSLDSPEYTGVNEAKGIQTGDAPASPPPPSFPSPSCVSPSCGLRAIQMTRRELRQI